MRKASKKPRMQPLFAEHEAKNFKDWENWEVLHGNNQPKRRRLIVQTSGDLGAHQTEANMVSRAELNLPRDWRGLRISLHMEEYEDVPHANAPPQGGPAQGLEPPGDLYDRVYEAWRRGEIADNTVQFIFGQDWLMLFQVTRDGLDDTGPTQLDTNTGGRGSWGTALRGQAGAVCLNESQEVGEETTENRDL